MLMDTDQPKQRLTSRVQIAQAILQLTDSGVPVDEWLPTLARNFYVDVDTFNEIVSVRRPTSVSQRQDTWVY